MLTQSDINAKVRELVNSNQSNELLKFLRKQRPEDVASAFHDLSVEDKILLFNRLNKEKAADVLEELDEKNLSDIINDIPDEKLTEIIPLMPDDDAADILQVLSEERKNKILYSLDEDDSSDIEELLQYDDDTAGGIMSKGYVSVYLDDRVGKVIRLIRENIDDEHILYTIYVVDDKKKLLGYVRLRDLVIAKSQQKIKNIYHKDILKVYAEQDQEVVAKLASKYNLMAVPVVDRRDKLIGIITYDDIVDVIQEESTEDILKMAGTDNAELVSNKIFRIASIRLPWLITSFVGSLAAAAIIKLFSFTLTKAVILASFIPVITGMGGNVGVQSSAITIRGIAVGRVHPSTFLKEILREFRVGFVMGIVVGLLLGAIAYIWNRNYVMGLAIGGAMFMAMSVAAVVGTFMPLFLKYILKIDPAIASGPFVSTANDITGLLVYLGLATFLLQKFPV